LKIPRFTSVTLLGFAASVGTAVVVATNAFSGASTAASGRVVLLKKKRAPPHAARSATKARRERWRAGEAIERKRRWQLLPRVHCNAALQSVDHRVFNFPCAPTYL
jgi:hypothetical protein